MRSQGRRARRDDPDVDENLAGNLAGALVVTLAPPSAGLLVSFVMVWVLASPAHHVLS